MCRGLEGLGYPGTVFQKHLCVCVYALQSLKQSEEKDQMTDVYRGIGEKKLSIPPHSPMPMAVRELCIPREVRAQPTILSTPFPIPMPHRDHVSLGRCGLSPPSTPPHSLSPCQAGDHVSLGRVQHTVLRKGEWDQPRLMAAALTLQYRENGVLRHSHMLPCMFCMCAAQWL